MTKAVTTQKLPIYYDVAIAILFFACLKVVGEEKESAMPKDVGSIALFNVFSIQRHTPESFLENNSIQFRSEVALGILCHLFF